MNKTELTTSLQTALDLLNSVAGAPRVTKEQRDSIAAFTVATGEALSRSGSAADEPRSIVWRIARLTNPTTGRELVLEINKNGRLSPSDAKRLGIESAPEWIEVRAVSRVEALRAIEAGEGVRYGEPVKQARKGGKTRKVEEAPVSVTADG